jgi:thymidylate synthase (FAD)
MQDGTEFKTKRSTNPGAEEILGRYFPVLDFGFVALIDYMGGDEDIVNAARVSYGAGTKKTSQTRGLIRYLHRHKHSTPKEMVELKFHCAMPIFVARQWIRHRTANVNEMSGRYSLLPMQFYTPPVDQLKPQSSQNNQGRAGELPETVREEAYTRWSAQRHQAIENYEWLNDHEVARELARIDLPLSTYTQWYWKIDLHNLLHFLTLRVDSHAQWEIQQYGKVMAGMMKRVAPLAYEAWIDYDVCGARLSRRELEILTKAVKTVDGSLLPNNPVSSLEMQTQHDLTTREIDEFLGIFSQRQTPDFELDLQQAKDGDFFAAAAAAAAPSVK